MEEEPKKYESHGTLREYRHGCRCGPCRDANAKSQREYQARKRAKIHGGPSDHRSE